MGWVIVLHVVSCCSASRAGSISLEWFKTADGNVIASLLGDLFGVTKPSAWLSSEKWREGATFVFKRGRDWFLWLLMWCLSA